MASEMKLSDVTRGQMVRTIEQWTRKRSHFAAVLVSGSNAQKIRVGLLPAKFVQGLLDTAKYDVDLSLLYYSYTTAEELVFPYKMMSLVAEQRHCSMEDLWNASLQVMESQADMVESCATVQIWFCPEQP